jgi:multiphosphoryl transfer protein
VSRLKLVSPLSGWCMPLAEVPDPVFAGAMAGDGVAIDPTQGVLCAPCAGEIVSMQGARHAVTVRSEAGIDVLMHVGIDTVNLKGEGFDLLVAPGDRVKQGDALLRFDLDRLARTAPSLVTPIVLASEGQVLARARPGLLAAGDFLMEVQGSSSRAASGPAPEQHLRRFRVPFDHGLHVRPAALIASALRPFGSEVIFIARGREGSARSTVAMMSLGVHCGETIEVRATGVDALAAIAALESLLAPDLPAVVKQEVDKPRKIAASTGRIEGVIASRGLAVGVASRWAQDEMEVEEQGTNPASDSATLRNAIAFVKDYLEGLAALASGDAQQLLQAHVELVQDPELSRRAMESINRGKSAAFAWRDAARTMAESLGKLDDERMRERASDLRDLESQVIRVLKGELPVARKELPDDAIVIADDLLPSQFIALDTPKLAGLCLARGGATSHVSIIAAANGIPMLVAAGPGVLEVADGTPVVLDAEHGWIDVDPPAAELGAAQRAAVQRAAEHAADLEAAQNPCSTHDGVRITVNANVGSVDEARAAVRAGAEGCGLLRTEFLFLDRREPPAETEQAAEYSRIAAALEGKPLTIRTMDIGGDKPIAYLPMPREDNPALGLRGVRASLWRPELLRVQLTAILRVQPHGQCKIMLPMVNDLEDLRTVRAIAVECARELKRSTLPSIGVMVETPAAAVMADQLAAEADFLSIGTNDLSQYTLAIDRGHSELADKLDALHPAVLRMIGNVAAAGKAAGKSVSVCGAMGSDVDALAFLIGLGVHEISATAAMIPRLKRTIRLLDAGECRELAQRAMAEKTAGAVRELALLARSRARASAESN